MASFRDALGAAAPLFDSTKPTRADNATTDLAARWQYFTTIFEVAPRSLAHVINTLGPTSLHSQRTLSASIQGPLERNQWQLDATHWWDISNAATQAAFIDAVYGPSNPEVLLGWDNFTGPLRDSCDNQVCCLDLFLFPPSFLRVSLFSILD